MSIKLYNSCIHTGFGDRDIFSSPSWESEGNEDGTVPILNGSCPECLLLSDQDKIVYEYTYHGYAMVVSITGIQYYILLLSVKKN